MKTLLLFFVFYPFIVSAQYISPFTPNMKSVYEIPVPAGFTRIPVSIGSFADWLRRLPLRKDKTVYLYDGTVKPDQTLHYAVIDISTGKKDLQQCADLVMRFRAEYFFGKKRYDSILFAAGRRYRFSDYIQPSRPVLREQLLGFMEKVFINCGTYSLDRQLTRVDLHKMEIGDVFIKGGSPGHAEIVVDMAVHNITGQKIFMLAESYMPAQDAHIMLNEKLNGPWYTLQPGADVHTPTWIFKPGQLKRW